MLYICPLWGEILILILVYFYTSSIPLKLKILEKKLFRNNNFFMFFIQKLQISIKLIKFIERPLVRKH